MNDSVELAGGATGTHSRTASARALVVDDSPLARRALANMLAGAGFDVEEASSARQAESLLDDSAPGSFDVILMDLHMPDDTGIEACARIKCRSVWTDVPVIVVTASDDDHHLTLAFAAGASDYISKPPRDFELLARVRAALRLKEEMVRRTAREAELEQLNERLREQAGELSAAQRALQELNQELALRVRVQVEEIVTRAREIEILNAQLRVQVQERSRELARALRRVSRRVPQRQALPRGKVLAGRAQLLRPLAEGGMGVIYAGRDLITGADVAIKLLDPGLGAGESTLQRFINEAAAAAAIAHPAVVKTTHVDVTNDGDLFLMMELVRGVTLQKILARGPLSPGWCVALGRSVADALAAAHRVGVIHRDIKPANLMVCRKVPGVRVLDFGISKIRALADRVTLTQTEGFLGTPVYMAPEQIEDPGRVTSATDIYGLGAVMFETVTGTRLFRDGRTRLLHVADDTPRVADLAVNVPGSLGALIDRCLARDQEGRPSAQELAIELSAMEAEFDAPPPHRLLECVRRSRSPR